MQTIIVRGLTLGEGRPKICVPVTAQNLKELAEQANALKKLEPDMCEWRIDWFGDQDELAPAARMLREHLPEMPLLFTFRTKAEGGERKLSGEEYQALCKELSTLPECDLIDIELFTAGETAAELAEMIHRVGKKVVFSSHDFDRTPPEEEIIARLKRMEALGGDLLKIAVMPNEPADVQKLLSATAKMKAVSSRPLITMSMGRLGAVSRVCGEIFGSSVTFGAAKQASAPGQIPVNELRQMMELFRPEGNGWVRVDAWLIPEEKAASYIVDREYYAGMAEEIFLEFCPVVRRDWAGSEDGEAVTACDENGRLMMHVHLDSDNVRAMTEADRRGEFRRWLLSDYIEEE